MIKLNNVSKRYRNSKINALSNINIQFEKGKIYGLLGRNGSGKSTLLKLISYKLFTSSGLILINEQLLSNKLDLSNIVHLLSDKNYYDENIRIIDHYIFISKINDAFNYENAISLSEQFGIDLNLKPKDLSTGYTSAFKICVALSMNVDYLLLDEPTNGLDANHRQLFYKLLIEYYQKYLNTIIISSHIIDEITNIIEHVVLVNEGELIINSDVEDLLNKAFVISGKDSLVRDYIKGMSTFHIDTKGFITNAYVFDKIDTSTISGLNISKITLQDLIILLTEKGEVQNEKIIW